MRPRTGLRVHLRRRIPQLSPETFPATVPYTNIHVRPASSKGHVTRKVRFCKLHASFNFHGGKLADSAVPKGQGYRKTEEFIQRPATLPSDSPAQRGVPTLRFRTKKTTSGSASSHAIFISKRSDMLRYFHWSPYRVSRIILSRILFPRPP
jgi:hypothetical protein